MADDNTHLQNEIHDLQQKNHYLKRLIAELEEENKTLQLKLDRAEGLL